MDRAVAIALKWARHRVTGKKAVVVGIRKVAMTVHAQIAKRAVDTSAPKVDCPVIVLAAMQRTVLVTCDGKGQPAATAHHETATTAPAIVAPTVHHTLPVLAPIGPIRPARPPKRPAKKKATPSPSRTPLFDSL
jgi:hypothetical protein